jgi:hypothetical protein
MLLGAAVVYVSSGGGAAATTQPFTVGVHVSPTTLRYPAQRSYVMTYTITTAARAESITITEGVGSWPEPRIFGKPWLYGGPSLQGPGRLSVFVAVADAAIGTCTRGSDVFGTGFKVDLPANKTTTVIQPVEIVAPPWPRMNWTPKLTVASADSPQGVALAAPHISLAGKTGVHIRLHSDPPVRTRANGTIRPFALGRHVVTRGSTDPVVVGARIRLHALRAGGGPGSQIALGTAITDRRGRFHSRRWRLAAPGGYLVFADYRHPRRGLVADGSCDLFLTAR